MPADADGFCRGKFWNIPLRCRRISQSANRGKVTAIPDELPMNRSRQGDAIRIEFFLPPPHFSVWYIHVAGASDLQASYRRGTNQAFQAGVCRTGRRGQLVGHGRRSVGARGWVFLIAGGIVAGSTWCRPTSCGIRPRRCTYVRHFRLPSSEPENHVSTGLSL